jgi:carbon monoxide dehydrogenase subunit G
MAQAKVVERIGAPVDAVFAILGNFRGVEPGPGIEAVDFEGDGVGMTRSIRLPNGTVVERLEAFDADARSYRYAIVNDDCPLPFADYSATVTLTDNGDGTTTVDWTGTFEPKGVAEDKAVALASSIYTNAIKGARTALGG